MAAERLGTVPTMASTMVKFRVKISVAEDSVVKSVYGVTNKKVSLLPDSFPRLVIEGQFVVVLIFSVVLDLLEVSLVGLFFERIVLFFENLTESRKVDRLVVDE